jgi:hypothetical protein
VIFIDAIKLSTHRFRPALVAVVGWERGAGVVVCVMGVELDLLLDAEASYIQRKAEMRPCCSNSAMFTWFRNGTDRSK